MQTDQIFLKAKGILRQVNRLPAWQKLALKVAMRHPKLLATMSPLFHLGLRLTTKKVDDGVFKPFGLYSPLIGEMTNRHIVDMPAKALTSMYGGLNKAENEKMRVIFYPGCAATLIYVNWGVAIIETLKHFGVSVYVPEVNKCCGIPSATMGEMGIYTTQVAENFDYFDTHSGRRYDRHLLSHLRIRPGCLGRARNRSPARQEDAGHRAVPGRSAAGEAAAEGEAGRKQHPAHPLPLQS